MRELWSEQRRCCTWSHFQHGSTQSEPSAFYNMTLPRSPSNRFSVLFSKLLTWQHFTGRRCERTVRHCAQACSGPTSVQVSSVPEHGSKAPGGRPGTLSNSGRVGHTIALWSYTIVSSSRWWCPCWVVASSCTNVHPPCDARCPLSCPVAHPTGTRTTLRTMVLRSTSGFQSRRHGALTPCMLRVSQGSRIFIHWSWAPGRWQSSMAASAFTTLRLTALIVSGSLSTSALFRRVCSTIHVNGLRRSAMTRLGLQLISMSF
mmetsp:Transcript_19646/g.31384  ORF Transcript_19646/g.31384 Transcript_19646/m.31384 type:complete len:260 (+) Transcript_19646:365-1144(+)